MGRAWGRPLSLRAAAEESSKRKGRIGVSAVGRLSRDREKISSAKHSTFAKDDAMPFVEAKWCHQEEEEDLEPEDFLDRYELTVSHHQKRTEIGRGRREPPKPEIARIGTPKLGVATKGPPKPEVSIGCTCDDTLETACDDSLQETIVTLEESGDWFDLTDELQDVASDCLFFFSALTDEASRSIQK